MPKDYGLCTKHKEPIVDLASGTDWEYPCIGCPKCFDEHWDVKLRELEAEDKVKSPKE